ncbi:MAG TPA: aminotransferase class V-fold PLP-dependent enzyme [Candidatus Limnocylindria bacterium]|nr:aminotransferase class V-fold PLP-dependent enzyme [Candidatus Limnocylindria bacterium]
MGVTDRHDAEALDAGDPLARFRDDFVVADEPRIYLDGNSLGRLPRRTAARLAAGVEEWSTRLVQAWDDWIELPVLVGDRLAAACLGARPGEVLVADSTTVNLFKLAHAALDLRPAGPVVTDLASFPTDRYVLEGIARARGRDLVLADTPDAALDVAGAALVCLSHVDYRSGRLLDLAAITASTESMVLWDLSHSIGAVPIDLSAADLAVGCTYKYLNAGPGAPAFLYVRRELQAQLRSPIQGWFGQREQFAMGPGYEPADGIERFHAGTPPVLGILAVDAGVELVTEAGIDRIAAKGEKLTDLIIGLHDAWLGKLGFELATPRSARERGSHVALRHPDAWPIARALIERAGVIPDFRPPDLVRLGVPALYTRFVDVWDAMRRLRDLVASGEHRTVNAAARRVT